MTFPGLEMSILKFHDISRFSMTVRTLIMAHASDVWVWMRCLQLCRQLNIKLKKWIDVFPSLNRWPSQPDGPGTGPHAMNYRSVNCHYNHKRCTFLQNTSYNRSEKTTNHFFPCAVTSTNKQKKVWGEIWEVWVWLTATETTETAHSEPACCVAAEETQAATLTCSMCTFPQVSAHLGACLTVWS